MSKVDIHIYQLTACIGRGTDGRSSTKRAGGTSIGVASAERFIEVGARVYLYGRVRRRRATASDPVSNLGPITENVRCETHGPIDYVEKHVSRCICYQFTP